MGNEHVVELSDLNFEQEVLRSSAPVLVDFHAGWCAPCRVIAPHVEAVARKHVGKLRVGKYDVDSDQQVAARYEVRNLPTLLVFRGGEVVAQIVGAVPRKRLDEVLAKVLG